jgi:hypothetical protein
MQAARSSVGSLARRSVPVALSFFVSLSGAFADPPSDGTVVTFRALLDDLGDPNSVARLPSPTYRQMQASSYNRASTKRGEPNWFADSDGGGFLRTEERGGRTEWVAMEYGGPGCLTRLWAPAFYNDLNVHDVPTVRIYLDGSETPTIEERWIPLLTNIASEGRRFIVPAPFASFTARAGDLYLPIPFARSCKVTFDRPPFYNIINWRAYEPGTKVECFTPTLLTEAAEAIKRAGERLTHSNSTAVSPLKSDSLDVNRAEQGLKGAPMVVRELHVLVDPAEIAARPSLLRSILLTIRFDDETTVSCPLGDFFGCPNALNPFETAARSVRADGVLTCRWPMPFRENATFRLEELTGENVRMELRLESDFAVWDERSMHFSAMWRPDVVLRGNEFRDLTLVDIRGQGVFVGDQLTVLNPTDGWWGEGDEKIYVDGSYERGFPDHFGTGTEDYYGWAGGVNPTWADLFSHPFLANIAVGSHAGAKTPGGTTRGFNICTRQRALDAIPFASRLVVHMEASPGVDQRGANDLLGYSTVAFWYARPGATANRLDEALLTEAVLRPIMSLPMTTSP